MVQAYIMAAHKENRDLPTRVETLEFPVHTFDTENSDVVSHHRCHRDMRGGGMHYRRDHRQRDHH